MGGGFTPLKISGCKLWFKGTSLSLNDGDPVSTWTDSSGNGHDASGTTTTRPLYKTNIINGLPTVLFDGTDDFMTVSGTPSVRPLTLFVVANPTANTSAQKNYATFISGGSTTMWMVAKITTSFWGTFTTPTGDLSSTNALTSGTSYLLEATATGSATTLYQKGTQVATRAESDVSPAGASLGKDLVTANRQYKGHIAEVLMYDSVLSSGNRVLVENYLIAKYAL